MTLTPAAFWLLCAVLCEALLALVYLRHKSL